MFRVLIILAILYVLGVVVSYLIFELYNSRTNRYVFKGSPSSIASQNVRRSVKDALTWPVSLVVLLVDHRAKKVSAKKDVYIMNELLSRVLTKYSAYSDEFTVVARNKERGFDITAVELDKINPHWREDVQVDNLLS